MILQLKVTLLNDPKRFITLFQDLLYFVFLPRIKNVGIFKNNNKWLAISYKTLCKTILFCIGSFVLSCDHTE